MTFNAEMTPKQLARWRLAFMLTNYLVGYLVYPSRILRSIRNVLFSSHEAATVFEHRLKDALHRFRVLASRPRAMPH
jgi:hypothetical protein